MPKRYATRPIDERGEANLARRVERLRRVEGWSYETLAQKMGDAGCEITKAAVRSIEKGDPPRRITVNELVALADIFTAGDVSELLKPAELVEQEWAEEVAQEWIAATKGLDDAEEALLGAVLRLAEASRRSQDLEEFVANHWVSASPARQWWARFSDEVDGRVLSTLAHKSNEFWTLMLKVLKLYSQHQPQDVRRLLDGAEVQWIADTQPDEAN